MLKKTTLTMASLSILYAVNAQAAEQELKLFIPDIQQKYEFSVGALWLQPGASNLNYVILNKAYPTQSPSWDEQELHPAYTASFDLGFRYFFPNSSGKDMKLDWTHLYSSTTSSTQAPDAAYFLGPDYEIGPAGIPITNADGKVQFTYDVVNLDFGQSVNFGQHFKTRFFGGLSTGFLKEEVVATYSGIRSGFFGGPFGMTQDVVSNFSGAGPRFGLEADYTFDSGFGILGEAGMSALIGVMHSSTTYTGFAQELTDIFGQATNYQTIKDQPVTQVVPGFDAKLGISYRHKFKNDILFKISAGYQAAVYINAISQYLPSSLVSGQPLESGGIFVATMSHTLSNYSVQGPFLKFSLEV